jgi:hypothetical protein
MGDGSLVGGRYELLDRLGAGGMGEVFRSRDRLTDGIVALKRARRESMANSSLPDAHDPRRVAEDRTTQFPALTTPQTINIKAQLILASEFRVLSSLRHPNIVSVLDYGFEANGSPFFTMQLLTDPVTIVAAAMGQPLDVQLDLLFQVLYALSYLHRHGIVHRDLKPSNILVMDRQVTVLDFGVSGLSEYTVAGTPGFIAPEVLNGGRPTPASDFYSVGGIAYEILTGERIRKSEEIRPAQLDPVGPVGGLVKTLLSHDPAERRYTDANRIVDDLARAAGREVPPRSADHRDSYLKAAPLIGRRAELDLLTDALESALGGRGSAWLVGGESGVGKSRLLDEIRSRAQVRGLLALSGSAEENQAPFAVFRQSLSRLTLLVDVSDEEAGLLKAVVPDIERMLARPVPDVAVDPQLFQERLIDVVCDLFTRHLGPILLELEDCHLLGESLRVVQRLTRLTDSRPLLIVASFRDNERPQLATECRDMRLIRLSRFRQAEVRDVAMTMLGRDLGQDPAVVSFLERETEGNAFFLVEAVRELINERGRGADVSPARLPARVFSGGMQEYVRRRLDRLPAWARGAMEMAAIIGRQVDLDVLRAAAPDADLDALLIVCGNAAILEGYGYQWRFTHDKLREALLAEMSPDARRALSAKGAAAIESVYGTAPEWIHTQAVLWKEGGVPDKAASYLLLAAAQLLSTGSPEKAVRLAVDAARQLEVELPDSREQRAAAIGAEMAAIGALMAGRGPAELVDLPRLTDDRVARVIGVLMLIGPAAHISQNLDLFALSTLKCFTLTLEHGVGADAPKVIAMYAAVVRGVTQNSRLAFDFSALAIELDRKLYGRVSSPVAFLHAWFVNHWIHPMKTNPALAWDGARVGFIENDTLYGCFNAAAHVIYLSVSGAPLPHVVQEADRQLARIAERVRVSAFHCVLERQLALALMGRTADRLSLSDDRYDEERDLASICSTSNHNQIGYYFLARMRLHYYHGEYEAALDYAERALPLLSAFQSQVAEWEFVFYRALASAARAQQMGTAERAPLLATIDTLLACFENWAEVGPANFAHKRDLIRAERFRARDEPDLAAAAYDAAVASAAASRFVHDLALAHERAALFHQAAGDAASWRSHAQLAATNYEEWGALAKVESLRHARVRPTTQ